MRAVLLISAAVLCAAYVSALTVTNQEMRVVRFDLPDGSYNIATFVVDFDADVYIKNTTTNSLIPYIGIKGNGPSQGDSALPLTTFAAKLVARLDFTTYTAGDCGANAQITSDPTTWVGGGGNGPPNFLMMASGSSDPASVFLSTMGGYALNLTMLPNRISAILIMNGRIPSPDALLRCTPKLTFQPGGAGTPTAYDSTGNAFAGSVTFTEFAQPKCTPEGLRLLKTSIETFFTKADSAAGRKEADQLNFMLASFETLGAWQGCRNLVEKFLDFGTKDVALSGVTDCMFPYGSAAFATSPCCNQTLQFSQCCASQTVTATVPMLNQIRSADVQAQCIQSGRIVAVLRDFITARLAQEEASRSKRGGDMGDVFQRYMSFMDTCQNDIFNKRCQTDADCPYSNRCDDQGSSRCTVEPTQASFALAKCYIQNMDPDLRYELGAMWGLPAKYASEEEKASTFAAAFDARVTSVDCDGPFAQFFNGSMQLNFRSRTEFKRSPDDGQWRPVRIPGDQAGCLSVKKCNWNPWNINNANDCVNQSPDPNFCGLCFGGQCMEISRPKRCFVNAFSQSECTAAQGTWIAQFGSFNGAGQCVDIANSTSLSQCMPSKYCIPQQTPRGDYFCKEGGGCYLTNVTTSQACFATGQGWWNQQLGACMANNAFSAQQCNALSSQYQPYFWARRNYDGGAYNTQQSCSAGVCSIWSVRDQGGNTTVCNNARECSVSCRKCTSFMNPNGMCFNISATTSTLCNAAPGTFWSQDMNRCVLNELRTQATCTAVAGTRWANCGSLSQNDCTSNVDANALKCQWNEYARCDTQGECEATGQCDDFEFQSCDQQGCKPGACVVPFQPDANGFVKPCDGGWSRVGCIRQNVANSSICTAIGGQWHSRAKNSAECAAHGQMCVNPQRPNQMNGYNSATCNTCGYQMKPVYTWTQGRWKSGTIMPTQWLARQWDSVNRWNNTLDYGKLNEAIQSAVARIMARETMNRARMQYLPAIAVMSRLACACTTGKETRGDACFAEVQRIARTQCRMDPGVEAKCGPVVFPAGAFDGNSSRTVVIEEIPCNGALGGGSGPSGIEVRAVGNSATYAVVKNTYGVVVGQVVGSAQGFSATTSAAVTICLEVNPSIDQDTDNYPVKDFAKADSSTSAPGVPMKISVTLDGLKYCASVTSSGYYYPILRATNTDQQNTSPPQQSDALSYSMAAVLSMLMAVLAMLAL
jgi:hypothetical protein